MNAEAEMKGSVLVTELEAEMLKTLKAVLEHVEDESVERVNGQCTLCFTYRKKLRDTITLAEGRTPHPEPTELKRMEGRKGDA